MSSFLITLLFLLLAATARRAAPGSTTSSGSRRSDGATGRTPSPPPALCQFWRDWRGCDPASYLLLYCVSRISEPTCASGRVGLFKVFRSPVIQFERFPRLLWGGKRCGPAAIPQISQ